MDHWYSPFAANLNPEISPEISSEISSEISPEVSPEVSPQQHSLALPLATDFSSDFSSFGQSELLLRAIFEQVAVGMVVAHPSGCIMQVNQAFCDFLDYSGAELQSRRLADLIHPEDWAASVILLEQLKAGTRSNFSLEKRYLRCDGSIFWANTTVSAIYDSAGALSFYVGLVQNINERKQTEAELEALFQAMPDLVLVMDGTGRYLKILRSYPGLLYRSAEELLDKTVHEVLPTAVADVCLQSIHQVLQSHQTVNFEYSLEIAGQERWFSANVSLLFEQSVLVVARDITAYQQMHGALQASEHLLTQVLNRTHASIVYLSRRANGEFHYEYMSPGCERIFGFTAEEFLADKFLWRSRVFPADLPRLLLPEQMQKESTTATEYRFYHRDGELRWISNFATVEWDETWQTWVLTAIDVDITERKRTEDALQWSYHRYEMAIQAGNVQVWDWSLDPTESSLEEHLNNWSLLLHPEDRSAVMAAIQTHLAEKTPYFEVESRFQHLDGSLHWVLTRGSILYERERPCRIVGTDTDITERKQAEAELQEKEAFLRSIYEGAKTSIFVVDVTETGDFRFAGLNPSHARATGLSPEDIQGKTPEDILPPAAAAQVRRNYQSCVNLNISIAYEEVLPLRGENSWWLTRLTPLYNQQGEIYRIIGTSINITRRKQAEANLRSSQERLAFLLTASPAVIYTAKADGDYGATFVSDNVVDLTGFTAEDFCLDSGLWRQQIHPEDRELVQQAVAVLHQQGTVCYEYRFWHQDGSERWIQDEAKLIYDSQRQPIEVVGYCIDVTSRKDAEFVLQNINLELEKRVLSRTMALRESEEKFRQLAENLNKVFWMRDLQGKPLYISPSYEQIWGLSIAGFYQNPESWLDLVHPEERDWMKALNADLSNFPEGDLEYRLLQSNGEVRWIRNRTFHIRNSQGKVYRIAGLAEDITDRKQAELEIRRSRELFEVLFQESADALFIVDPHTLLNLDCNQRAVELFEAGHKDALIGIMAQTLHKHPFPDHELAAARSQLSVYGVWNAEIEYRTFRGNDFWGNIATKKIEVDGQQRTLVRITDISNRKQVERLLQQQAERESLLKQVAFQTRDSLDLDQVLHTTVSRVRDFLQTDRVVIYRFESEIGGWIQTEAVSRPEFAILGQYLEDPCFKLGLAEQYRMGYTSAISDIWLAEIATCHAEFLARVQVRANLVVPILQNHQLWGLLIAHHCTAPRHWQPFELDVLKQVAEQVSITIHQIGLYAQLEIQLAEQRRVEQALEQQVQREQLVRVLSLQIRHSLELDEILEASVTEVRQVLQADRALVFHLNEAGEGVVVKESVSPPYPVTAEMRFPDEYFSPECYEFYCQGHARPVFDVTLDSWANCLVHFMQRVGVKSKIVAPILQTTEAGESVVWGLLIVHSCANYRHWQPSEVTLVQQVAVQMGIAIQQSDLYLRLAGQLRQKEVLLKEVHHRVKNNLQVISAMLNLQVRASQDQSVRSVLEDSRSRLRAIALIHETLYQSGDLERLEFHDYVQRLAAMILSMYGSSTQIHLDYQLQAVFLNLETAIPCGLLLSELITNAIKHAFPAGRPGVICITLKPLEEVKESVPTLENHRNISMVPTSARGKQPSPQKYVLMVEDDGVGVPADLDIQRIESLGLKIVYDLALQLRATLHLDRFRGTRFQLTFSELEYRKRF